MKINYKTTVMQDGAFSPEINRKINGTDWYKIELSKSPNSDEHLIHAKETTINR